MANSCIINPCIKGMTKDTCPYNPLLGCDCRANLKWSKERMDKFISDQEAKKQVRDQDIPSAKEE